MKRDFESWIKDFKVSIASYNYYINFDKVYKNTERLKIELNILNSLIGSKDIENEFEKIITKYPETLKCIPTLLAVREKEIYCSDKNGSFKFNFEKANYPISKYKYFMKKTGLFDLLTKHLINNLVDYVLGVETGLDSNGRKNRGGDLMENLVEGFIIQAGYKCGVDYYKEIRGEQLCKKYGIDLKGNMINKRFDFAIVGKKTKNIYAVETNFYSGFGGGSKLNETARSYKELALETKSIKGFKFMWITDGTAWWSVKNNLRETFNVLDNLYSIKDLENGVLKRI